MPVSDMLGNRMKEYERRNQYWLQRRTPVAIRVDMKAGHSFTKGFQRPFDEVFVKSMQDTAKFMCENIQGAVLSFQQSDEITIILQDYKTLTTDAWFDYRTDKLCSIAASMATLAFNKFFSLNIANNFDIEYIHMYGPQTPEDEYAITLMKAETKGAMFDARCFNIPKEEVTNLVYWRQLDATRNSIQMVGQANFSHGQLQGKSCNMIQDMLYEYREINWNDYPTRWKRGVACYKVVENFVETEPSGGWAPDKEIPKTRSYWKTDYEMPILRGEDREYVDRHIFVGE